MKWNRSCLQSPVNEPLQCDSKFSSIWGAAAAAAARSQERSGWPRERAACSHRRFRAFRKAVRPGQPAVTPPRLKPLGPHSDSPRSTRVPRPRRNERSKVYRFSATNQEKETCRTPAGCDGVLPALISRMVNALTRFTVHMTGSDMHTSHGHEWETLRLAPTPSAWARSTRYTHPRPRRWRWG